MFSHFRDVGGVVEMVFPSLLRPFELFCVVWVCGECGELFLSLLYIFSITHIFLFFTRVGGGITPRTPRKNASEVGFAMGLALLFQAEILCSKTDVDQPVKRFREVY